MGGYRRRWTAAGLGRRPARAAVGAGGGAGGGPAPFAYSDIPDQLLRISSVEGSLVGSGGVLTGVTDMSPAAEAITVASSPTYTASDANLNGQPSFGPPLVTVSGIDPRAISFAAFVGYTAGTASVIFSDGIGALHRFLLTRETGGTLGNFFGANPTVETASAGRKRALVPVDGATLALWNGSNSSAAVGANNLVIDTGLTIGSRYSGTQQFDSVGFFMACSSVPDAAARAALEAKLLVDYG